MASIIIASGSQEGMFLPLGKKTSVIGRDEAVPLQVPDERASRKHCQIRFEPSDNTYRLLDMKSSNGTFVKGRRIDSELVLQDGDEIEIGSTKLLFTAQNPTDKVNAMAVLKQVGERFRSTLMK